MNSTKMPSDYETALMADLNRDPIVRAPASPMKPPTYGQPQNDAISSVVDGIVQDISRRIDDLRKKLDELEQQVLEGAARAKTVLKDQVSICVRVSDEVNHMSTVVEEIRDQAKAGTI